MTTPDAYLRQLQALLPQGAAWPRDDDANLTRLLRALADGLGYTVAIVEPQPFQADLSAADDPAYDDAARFTWIVTIVQTAEWWFRADLSSADDPVVDRPQGVVECLFARLKPAHTSVLFNHAS